MVTGWAPDAPDESVHPMAAHALARRVRLAGLFADKTLVLPTGPLSVRSNDTDYRFRPGSDFFYLTGCDQPDCVLLIAPGADGPRSTLYIAPRRDQSTHEFFADDRYGELWVGRRRGVAEAAVHFAIDTAPLEYLEKDLASCAEGEIVTLRGVDPRVDVQFPASDLDEALAVALAKLRLVKDDFEIAELQRAVDYTVLGFTDVVRALPAAQGRGERVVEGVFNLRARVEGNDVGYGTIAASGSHATVLHWTQNDGPVRAGDLLLLDAGVEVDTLYTADVTRTLPVSGRFSPAQRRVYELVLAAQEAGIAAVRPGVSFYAAQEAAFGVLAAGLVELGLLAEAPSPDGDPSRQMHKRYSLHGVSHWLGLDVHDCAAARDERHQGVLAEGHVLTVEPGLYFQPHDLTVPEEYRGIGVRIEDDVLVTADGARNLSAGLPRAADDVEAWIADVWSRGTTDLGL
ncbi:MAG: aminopeptidase P family protein [Acidobacteriota bacterium]|nr:aminopeptidase P family protein [Acidobacteriota bacterium]